jgi:hypothetical protein
VDSGIFLLVFGEMTLITERRIVVKTDVEEIIEVSISAVGRFFYNSVLDGIVTQSHAKERHKDYKEDLKSILKEKHKPVIDEVWERLK